MKKSSHTYKASQRKRVNEVLKKIELLQPNAKPTQKFTDEYTLKGNVRPEFIKEFNAFEQHLLYLNPYRSFARLAKLMPFYSRMFLATAKECLTYYGYTEDEATNELIELTQSKSFQDFNVFVQSWIHYSQRNIRKLDLHKIVNRSIKGIKYQRVALIAIFDNFIYLQTLFKILEKELSMSKRLGDTLKEYNHYTYLVKLRNGKIRESQLPNITSNLTFGLREWVLEKFDFAIGQWNILTNLDGKEMMDLQIEAIKKGGFSIAASETVFKDVLNLVETETNSRQSKILALQPFFRRTHKVLSYREWAEARKIAITLGDKPAPDYKKYVIREVSRIIGVPTK